ncbi:MAG TPA: hypothetical protein VNT25_06070, partial [Allosphingosinicella sp.]|nr:hypothetical protein [Allosphingosinicella sp.]
MMFRKVLFLATTLVAAQAQAQSATLPASEAPALPLPVGPAKVSWSIELVPVLSGKVPLQRGERISTSENSSLRFGLTAAKDLNEAVIFSMKNVVGLTDEFEETGNDASSIRAEFKLGSRRRLGGNGCRTEARNDECGGLKPYVSYTPEASFSEILDDYLFLDHVFALGLAYDNCADVDGKDDCEKRPLFLKLTPSVDRIWSDRNDRERFTPRILAEIGGPLVRDVTWVLSWAGEAQLFRSRTLDDGAKQRDYRSTTGGKIDVAKAL